MASDSLKICFVTGNDRCADASRCEGDQHVKGQISQFIGLIAFALSHGIQKIRRMDPLPLGRRKNLAPVYEIDHEPSLNPRLSTTKQFMHHDRGAPDDKWRSEDLRSESRSAKVFDVDRGIENGKLNCA